MVDRNGREPKPNDVVVMHFKREYNKIGIVQRISCDNPQIMLDNARKANFCPWDCSEDFEVIGRL